MLSIGVDLGQQADPSTAAVGSLVGEEVHLVHLHRWPLGTDYTDVLTGIMDLYDDPRLAVGGHHPLLAVDETGVGRGVSDLLGREGAAFYAVTITSGGTPHPYASKGPRGSWRVPKAALIEALARPFRNGHLKIARDLRWGPALAEELRTFRRVVNPKTAHVKLEHASGKHDDLVLAAALSAWRLDADLSTAPARPGVDRP